MAEYAIYNPHNKPVTDLPIIYGFNNGSSGGILIGVLLAEDGTPLGSHGCSSEGFMLGDLGIVEGRRPDRHEYFCKHYQDGYRMDFVSYDAVPAHAGLRAAFKAYEARSDPEADGSPDATDKAE